MGGAPALPTPTTPGYTSFRGFTACVCLAKWLPVYEQLLLVKGLIQSNIDIWQLTGAAAASAGTHSQGGAFDIFQTTDAHVAVSREMGAPATWRRTVAQGFTRQHTHGVLSGCPHNSPAAYQITAQKAGYDGLGYLGRGGKDYHPDPTTYRTWTQGIAWAQAEIKKIEEAAMPTPAELWSVEFTSPVDGQTPYKASSWLIGANVKAGEAKALASKALAEVAALRAAFDALAKNPDLTPEQVTAAAKAGAQAALDEKITGAVTNLTVGP